MLCATLLHAMSQISCRCAMNQPPPKKNRLNLQGLLLINKSTAVSFFLYFNSSLEHPFSRAAKPFVQTHAPLFSALLYKEWSYTPFFKGAMYIEDLSFFKEILHTEHLSCPVLPLWSGDPFSRLPRSCQQQRSNCYSLSL